MKRRSLWVRLHHASVGSRSGSFRRMELRDKDRFQSWIPRQGSRISNVGNWFKRIFSRCIREMLETYPFEANHYSKWKVKV